MEGNLSNQPNRSTNGNWLRALILRDTARWSIRLGALMSWLKLIGRGRRRRLGRAAAGVFAGASGVVLMALLAGPMAPPVHAATIDVGPSSTCTSLIDAIHAANRGTTVNGCTGSAGPDTIVLSQDALYGVGLFTDGFSGAPSAVPIITSTIRIESTTDPGKEIGRLEGIDDEFRVLTVAASGDLTLSNVLATSGRISDADGGIIFIQSGGKLTLERYVRISDGWARGAGSNGGAIFAEANTSIITDGLSYIEFSIADGSGGGIYSKGVVSMNESIVLESNARSGHGGGIFMGLGGSLSVQDSYFEYNWTGSIYDGGGIATNGGAIYAQGATSVVITDTLFEGNEAGDERNHIGSGGALYLKDVPTAIIDQSAILDGQADVGGLITSKNTNLTISNSRVDDGMAIAGDGGALLHDGGLLTIENSSFIYSTSMTGKGGAIWANPDAGSTIVNTTVSGNSAPLGGSGLYVKSGNLSLTHVTVADNNNATGSGGGIYAKADLTLNKSIVSGNTALTQREIKVGGTFSGSSNVLGSSESTNTQAFNFTPGAGNRIATSDGSNSTAVRDIIGELYDGGNIYAPDLPYHYPVYDSPAVDLIKGATCDPATDQLGEPRPHPDSYGCDAGAVESYYYAIVDSDAFISTWTFGSVDDIDFTQLDILMWDGDAWSKWFDGMEAGLNPDAYKPNSRWKHNINAMSISDVEAGDVYMSFTQNDEPVPGIPGRVDGMDVVFWDGQAEEWELIFKGSLKNIGLNNKTQEKIDGLHVLPEAPEWSEFSGDDCEAYMLISTQGPGLVPKPGNIKPKNVLKFGGEDVLGFCATNLGPNTTGFWEMVLDGSALGVVKNNIESISMNEDETVLYVTSKKAFAVDSAFGGHSMVFAFDMGDEYFDGPYLRFMDDLGIQSNVDALHITGELEMP